jgi:hypothetical protein
MDAKARLLEEVIYFYSYIITVNELFRLQLLLNCAYITENMLIFNCWMDYLNRFDFYFPELRINNKPAPQIYNT